MPTSARRSTLGTSGLGVPLPTGGDAGGVIRKRRRLGGGAAAPIASHSSSMIAEHLDEKSPVGGGGPDPMEGHAWTSPLQREVAT
jgi:hypothetical protein